MSDQRTPSSRRTVISVIGSSVASPSVLAAAETVGLLLIDAGARVANGGLGGVMEATARGAHRSARYREGDVIGLLPGTTAAGANAYVDIAIPTGMHFARNALVTGIADAVIAIGGRAGTLSEIALAWQQGKPVVLLDLDDGWSTELAGRALDSTRADVLERAETPEQAVELAMEAAAAGPRPTTRKLPG
jgi:uncharacterized protein (TIGR00725 family)